MQIYTWWVDEPWVMASSNPSDEDLERLRVLGFSVVLSLLEEKKQPPRYDKKSAAGAGWANYPIPIEERGVPSRDQVSEPESQGNGRQPNNPLHGTNRPQRFRAI
jgi:hypothetical protein